MKRVAIASLAVAVLSLTACSSGASSTGTAPGVAKTTTTQAPATTEPGVGATQSFHLEDVTLSKVIDPAAIGSFAPPTGDRFVAVELGIKNTGSAALSPTPIFDAILVDQGGHSYTPVVNGTPSCQDFAGSLSIDPSSSASGCVLFEVPTAEAPAKFQYISKEAGANVERTEWSF